MVDVVEKIVEDRPFGKLIGEIDAAGNRARSVARIVGAVGVPMHVHEDIALDPGIGTVEVEVIIARAIKDIVDELQNRAGTLAAGEVDRVVETPGASEIVASKNAVAARGDAVDSMQTLGP